MSAYGTGNTPGMRPTLNGATLFGIRAVIEPLDRQLFERAEVRPCTEESCNPISAAWSHASFEAMQHAISELSDLFEKTQKHEGADACSNIQRSLSCPTIPSPEDNFIASGLGLGLNIPSCTLADVYAESRNRGGLDEFNDLMLSAMNVIGPRVGISEFYKYIHKQLNTLEVREREIQTKSEELSALELSLSQTQLNSSTSSSSSFDEFLDSDSFARFMKSVGMSEVAHISLSDTSSTYFRSKSCAQIIVLSLDKSKSDYCTQRYAKALQPPKEESKLLDMACSISMVLLDANETIFIISHEEDTGECTCVLARASSGVKRTPLSSLFSTSLRRVILINEKRGNIACYGLDHNNS